MHSITHTFSFPLAALPDVPLRRRLRRAGDGGLRRLEKGAAVELRVREPGTSLVFEKRSYSRHTKELHPVREKFRAKKRQCRAVLLTTYFAPKVLKCLYIFSCFLTAFFLEMILSFKFIVYFFCFSTNCTKHSSKKYSIQGVSSLLLIVRKTKR